MSRFTRATTLIGGSVAVAAALLGAGTGTASAAQATPSAAHTASVVRPADESCGWNGGGLFGQAMYLNCSPYSVGIRIEWWFWQGRDDSYMCVPAHWNVVLNNAGDTPPYFAVFDGQTNC